jgi:hypothetical protein
MIIRTAMKLLKPKVVLAVALAAGAWQVYSALRAPAPSGLDTPRQEAADKACWLAVEALPKLPEAAVDPTVAVLRLHGDATGYVTGKLREIVERTGAYTQPPPSLFDRIKDRLDMAETPVGTPEAAVAAGAKLEVPYVLFGRVSAFTSDHERGRIRLDVTLLDVATSAELAPTQTVQYPEPEPESEQGAGGTLGRILLWLAATALIPLLTLPLIRSVLERESNGATLIALVVWTGAPVTLALWIPGFAVSGWQGWTSLIIAVIIAGGYNYYIFATEEEKRSF